MPPSRLLGSVFREFVQEVQVSDNVTTCDTLVVDGGNATVEVNCTSEIVNRTELQTVSGELFGFQPQCQEHAYGREDHSAMASSLTASCVLFMGAGSSFALNVARRASSSSNVGDWDLLPEFVAPLAEAPAGLDLPAETELLVYVGLDRA